MNIYHFTVDRWVEHFYSELKRVNILIDDCNFALKLFKPAPCETIKDYVKLYLIVDALLLLEVFEKIRDNMFEKYILDPSYFIATPSSTMAAA